ncbi:hypothetical protein C8F01DRAFT_1119681 [Mycena amicta]|nr:hypothetical protein C8F01DRAFT_1119681 [Mycena amicta]
MGFELLALPTDILLTILLLLDVADILQLTQTCRGLHDTTLSSDYLWHQLLLPETLPLNLDYADLNQLSAATLQKATRDALRLDNNWRRRNPQIRQMTRISMENVSQMLFLGSELLVVLRRSPPSLSIWRVAAKHTIRVVASVNLPDSTVPLKFAATMQKEEVLIALISSTKFGTQLCAYAVALSDENNFTPASFRVVCDISGVDSDPGPFYEVHVYADIIAIGIHSILSPRILFINASTGLRCMVNPHLPEGFAQLHFKLVRAEPCQIVLTGVDKAKFVVRKHDLPTMIVRGAKHHSETVAVEDLAAPVAEYESPAFSDLDYTLCADSTHRIGHISGLSFHSLSSRTEDFVFCFPLAPGETYSIRRFQTHFSASAEQICLGESGTRSIWLERRWTSDDYTLMKAVISSEEVVVEPLLGKHLALPFELHMCQGLAFDEGSGCVGIAFPRELYLLEF